MKPLIVLFAAILVFSIILGFGILIGILSGAVLYEPSMSNYVGLASFIGVCFVVPTIGILAEVLK